MASNQTEHYGLSQWELTDDVRMEDFNSDNAKIDAALADKYGPNVPGWITGSYTGDGEITTREITLGFRPKALFITASRIAFGMAIDVGGVVNSMSTFKVDVDVPNTHVGRINFTETGFTVTKTSSSHSNSLNDNGSAYHYLALK